MDFNSHTDAVVRVAVGLVNLLTPGNSLGREYQPPADEAERAAAVTALLRGGGGKRAATAAEATALCAVADELRDVFIAVDAGLVDDAAELVNAMLTRTGARPELERHDGEPWHLHFHAADRSMVHGWAAGCATGLAVVLGSELYDRLGVCTAPRCDRVYVDISRNGTRRYCSTACQNRVKTAAFRARGAQVAHGVLPGGAIVSIARGVRGAHWSLRWCHVRTVQRPGTARCGALGRAGARAQP